MKNNKQEYKPCRHCNGSGKTRLRRPPQLTPDTKKLLNIMKRNKFSQSRLAKELGLSQGTISGWFNERINIHGKINPAYFALLKSKGFK